MQVFFQQSVAESYTWEHLNFHQYQFSTDSSQHNFEIQETQACTEPDAFRQNPNAVSWFWLISSFYARDGWDTVG